MIKGSYPYIKGILIKRVNKKLFFHFLIYFLKIMI